MKIHEGPLPGGWGVSNVYANKEYKVKGDRRDDGAGRLLPDLVGHLAVSSEARKFYCPCSTDVEAKAQRCQEVSSQSWIPHPGGFQSATPESGVLG